MLFIFDMGGVVTTTAKMDSIFKALNISMEDFYLICKQGDNNIWKALQRGEITVDFFWQEFNRRIGLFQRGILDGVIKIGDQVKFSSDITITDVQNVQRDLFRLYFHPVENPKTIELVQALKKKHRVVCGTNTIQSHWENHVERGDYSYFHQTYASNKINEVKPNPEFYKIIMEAEGYSPEETFFTDDKEENIEAAAKLGIHAVLFTTAEELTKEWQKYC